MRLGASFFGLIWLSATFAACGGDDGDGGGGNSGASCVPKSDACYVSGPTGPGASCLAKFDNTGSDVWQGRINQITVKRPDVLSSKFVHDAILDRGIFLNQPECFEQGEGTFSWLFEFNRTTGKMRTGGSLPVKDPKAGGCFLTMTTTALPVAPISVDVTFDPDGLGFTATDIDVVVPIFNTPDDTSNPILLPLHKVELKGAFSDDTHNCIGKHNGETLDPSLSCKGDFNDGQRPFTTGANLKGYIRVDEADKVFIDDIGATLCAYLAGITQWSGPNKDCASSDKWKAGERPNGDWCAATNAPFDANCKDAWILEGDFSASAFKINGDCP
ncbi:MAG: hypothetical protein R3B13_26840 [Polyangiaceae bacterium]